MVETAAIRIALPGAAGRMGRMITRVLDETTAATLVAATDHADSPHIGKDCGSLNGLATSGVLIADSATALTENNPQVIVDFTTPQATMEHLRLAISHGIAMMIGTTGLDETAETAIRKAAESIPVVWCANTSIGVTLLARLVEQTARQLGDGWDIEILETHHRHKVDAPSGTALALGEAVARGRGVALGDVAVFAREGITGARKDGEIGFATLRGGDVAGEHAVIFHGIAERLELTHRATDRVIFARGALRAAAFAAMAEPGLYTMDDVLAG